MELLFGETLRGGIAWAHQDESDAIEKRRKENMAISGHECISYKGESPQCYPYSLEIVSATYGGESKRATENLMELCGRGTKSWCKFKASNSVLELDPTTKEILDPKKGERKNLKLMYRCMLPTTHTPVGTREKTYEENETVFLNCTEEFRTIFKSSPSALG